MNLTVNFDDISTIKCLITEICSRKLVKSIESEKKKKYIEFNEFDEFRKIRQNSVN